MQSKETIIRKNVHKLRLSVDSQKRIQINERRILGSRHDRPGLSQMRPKNGLSY